MKAKQDVGAKPPQVMIFKISGVVQNYTMIDRVGEFVGHIVFDHKSRSVSSAIKIMLDDGYVCGYVPAERIGDVLEFTGHKDIYPCKGIINSKYDLYSEMFYYWGECIIKKL